MENAWLLLIALRLIFALLLLAAYNGILTCNVTLSLLRLHHWQKPIIEWQSSHISVLPDTTTSLKVSARGIPPPSYQWYVDGKPLHEADGGTGSELLLRCFRPEDVGVYVCRVANEAGSVMTRDIEVRMAPAVEQLPHTRRGSADVSFVNGRTYAATPSHMSSVWLQYAHAITLTMAM
jgi:hypothetical protein